MTIRKPLSRRTVLRGAGTVIIGLPLLEEMFGGRAFAQAAKTPVRAFNVFFGLGVPTPLQSEGFTSTALAPLAELKDKLLMVRGVDHVRVDEGGSNAHYDGSAGAFTAEMPNGTARAGGISIDQALRAAAYPNGQPAGVIPTLLAGTYFRRDRVSRFTHCWREDGSAADVAHESPVALFDRIFGSAVPGEGGEDPAAARAKRLRRSVLDSTLEQYRHYQSDASNLGAASRSRIADHLEAIREHELRVFAPDEASVCETPTKPGASVIPHGAAADPGGEGIDITLDALVKEWRLMADLYALAVRCDRVRFGGLTFQAAGERIRLKGRYEYGGKLVYDFDDRRDRNNSGGASGCSHEFWHAFNPTGTNTQMRAHLHLMMREVTYFLKLLDDPQHLDPNGKTILDNALVTVSTESGDGRHNDVKRELSGVFHLLTAAGGVFKTGELNATCEGLDLYNTVLKGLGFTRRMGPSTRTMNEVTAILR